MLDLKKLLTKLIACSYASGTDGIWTYRKYADHTYHAWYVNAVNFKAGSAWLGGYYHQTTSALNPPSFSTGVSTLTGQANSPQICIYCGHAADYSTYWLDAVSGTRNDVPVRLDMYGTW